MRVLTFTSIFPNAQQPFHGLFVAQRIRALARLCDIRVVAPVPWAPRVNWLPRRYAAHASVLSSEWLGDLQVGHPRFFVIPKVLKTLDPVFMAGCCHESIAELRRTFDFEVIDAHWACPDGVAAALLARRFGVPLAITVRGDDINVFAQERGRRQAIRLALTHADLVIALSSDLGRAVQRLGVRDSRIAVIPNGVDPERFRSVDRELARRRLQIPRSERMLLAVGRLHQSKGYPVLVEALAKLRHEFPDLVLRIVGERDPEADAMPAILGAATRLGVRDRVMLTRAQSPDTLVDFYSAADLFCLATSREGSANVLLEALACGLPCVTTPVGGNPDIISSRDVGVLAGADPAEMAAAIASALSTRWDRKHISAIGQARTWDVVAEECHHHLASLI